MSEETTKMTRPTGEPGGGRRHRAGRRWGRWRARMRKNRALDLSWRVAVFVVGGALVLAGMVMLVTPGPGWLGIIVGLAVLATEFDWADGLLRWARRRAAAASARALDPATRRRNLVLGLAAVVVLAALAWWWVAAYGWPEPVHPTIRWLRGLP